MSNKDRILENNQKILTNNASVGNIIARIKQIPAPLDTSDATAVQEDILKDKTAYVNGKKITGILEIPEPILQDKEIDITENGTTSVVMDEGYDGLRSVQINTNVSGGGEGIDENADVLFIDYDGTVVYSYSKNKFLNLTEMPPNLTHEGLVSEGWNWSLVEAKDYVSKYGGNVIGQTYRTMDKATRIHIKTTKELNAPHLCFYNQGGQINIDWGDGDTLTTSTWGSNEIEHIYNEPGEYIISIKNDGILVFQGNSSNGAYLICGNKVDGSIYNRAYANIVKGIFIGSSIILSEYCFYNFSNLEFIILGSISDIPNYAFYNNFSLKALILKNTTTIGTYGLATCYRMKYLSFSKKIIQLMAYAVYACYSLKRLYIPDTITSLANYVFSYFYDLDKIVIPESIKTISDYSFYVVYSLEEVTMPESIESIGNYSFGNWRKLKKIRLHNNLKTIGDYTFSNNMSMIEFETHANTIGKYVWQNCRTLSKVIFYADVNSIGQSAFENCDSLTLCDFSRASIVPELSASIFTNANSNLKIVVPDALYIQWRNKQYWQTYSNYIVKASEYFI